MTDSLTTELARKCIGPISEPNVAVTREFLKAILAHIQKPHVCPHCEERPAFQIPERDDGPHAPRMFAALARFNAVEAGSCK